MIEISKLKDNDFKRQLEELESSFVEELENMIYSHLMEEKIMPIPGKENEIVEFAGKTNFKIRLKRPNKNVWSIPVQSVRKSIQKVLREGNIKPVNKTSTKKDGKEKSNEFAVWMLLQSIPDEEYEKRSFVGNPVVHPTLGEGKVKRISSSGNVEVSFPKREAVLKPGFIHLKTI